MSDSQQNSDNGFKEILATLTDDYQDLVDELIIVPTSNIYQVELLNKRSERLKARKDGFYQRLRLTHDSGRSFDAANSANTDRMFKLHDQSIILLAQKNKIQDGIGSAGKGIESLDKGKTVLKVGLIIIGIIIGLPLGN